MKEERATLEARGREVRVDARCARVFVRVGRRTGAPGSRHRIQDTTTFGKEAHADKKLSTDGIDATPAAFSVRVRTAANPDRI